MWFKYRSWINLRATTLFVSRDSLMGIVTGLKAAESGTSIPRRATDFSLLQNIHTCPAAHPASYVSNSVVQTSCLNRASI